MEGECFGCGDDNPLALGLTFSREGDRCVAIFRPRREHRGVPGFLHGGLAATVLDETMASLGFMLDDVHTVTATLELKYRKPVPLAGAVLRVESWRDDPTPRRRHRVHGRLLLADGTVAVEAEGIFLSVPAGSMAWRP
jgi:acyl-coenzyme A thioesterase PaaI-like protein